MPNGINTFKMRKSFVSRSECSRKSSEISKGIEAIGKKQDEMLVILRGDPKSRTDSGLVGDFEDLKGTVSFNQKVLYSVIGIGITVGLAVLTFYLTSGGA